LDGKLIVGQSLIVNLEGAMDEPVRFADILFTFLTLATTFAILYLVNKVRNTSKQPPAEESEAHSEKSSAKDSA
jgi:hypothetical protein